LYAADWIKPVSLPVSLRRDRRRWNWDLAGAIGATREKHTAHPHRRAAGGRS